MTVLVACGQIQAWCEFAQSQFEAIGIPAPRPTARTGLSATMLVAKMHSAIDGDDPSEAASPGRAWEIAASDLFIENSSANPWGFADSLNLDILEFWERFDPNIRFVLVYGSPSDSLVATFDRQHWNNDNLEKSIAHWSDYHDRLLDFYYKHTDRSLLVHIDELAGTADQLVEKLNTKFGLNTSCANESRVLTGSRLDHLIAEGLINESAYNSALYDELNISADMPRSRPNSLETDQIDGAIEELSNLYRISSENAELRGKCDALISELAELQDTLRNREARAAALERLVESSNQENAKLRTVESELEREREDRRLIQQHLDQTRDELTRYFENYQYLARAFGEPTSEQGLARSSDRGEKDRPDSLTFAVNMSSYIDGAGWYGPEPEGRWAGAAPISSISIPHLAPASRVVNIQVENAISLAHLNQLEILFNGAVIPHRVKILANLDGPMAQLRRLKAILQAVPNPFPAQITARIDATLFGDQNEMNTLSLKTIAPSLPSGRDTTDNRALSICVSKIQIS